MIKALREVAYKIIRRDIRQLNVVQLTMLKHELDLFDGEKMLADNEANRAMMVTKPIMDLKDQGADWMTMAKLSELKVWLNKNLNAKKKDWFRDGDQPGQPQVALNHKAPERERSYAMNNWQVKTKGDKK